jgi:2-succinyl-5-enolpyruvyl-6-hydroxy-3-cyclohexene-1-carboxylate synthase
VAAVASTLDRDVLDDLVNRLAGRRVVVVVGGGTAPATATAVHGLAEAANWPVLADPRSGAYNERPSTVAHWDALLRLPDFVTRHQPDVVLRVGAPPASKVLAEWLANRPTRSCCHPAPGWPTRSAAPRSW